MKIAIPMQNEKISDSFGRCEYFLITDLENSFNKKVFNDLQISGAGVKSAQKIVDEKVDALITSKCGQNAFMILKKAKIKIFKSTSKNVLEQLNKLKYSELENLENIENGIQNV